MKSHPGKCGTNRDKCVGKTEKICKLKIEGVVHHEGDHAHLLCAVCNAEQSACPLTDVTPSSRQAALEAVAAFQEGGRKTKEEMPSKRAGRPHFSSADTSQQPARDIGAVVGSPSGPGGLSNL